MQKIRIATLLFFLVILFTTTTSVYAKEDQETQPTAVGSTGNPEQGNSKPNNGCTVSLKDGDDKCPPTKRAKYEKCGNQDEKFKECI